MAVKIKAKVATLKIIFPNLSSSQKQKEVSTGTDVGSYDIAYIFIPEQLKQMMGGRQQSLANNLRESMPRINGALENGGNLYCLVVLLARE